MIIYLAGYIPKGDEEAKTFDNWRARYQQVLEQAFDATFIDPEAEHPDEGDAMSVVGSDSKHIQSSDLVVVYAEEQLGVGTSQEMVIAKYFKKPVITVLPKDTFHRRSNIMFNGTAIDDWVHPFIRVFSDFVVESVNDILALRDNITSVAVKDISIIDEAIARNKSL